MSPIEAIFATLGLISFISYMVESAVEFLLGIPADKFPQLEKIRWLTPYFACAAGVACAFYYRFDIVALLAQFFGKEGVGAGIPGIILTGLAMGRGSNYLHDIVQKFFPPAEKR